MQVKMSESNPKYVIFDLDETLGFFTELSIIWGCLQTVYDAKGQETFNKLCSIFEDDYFRPGIFKVFRFLKKQGDKVRVVLYTNNIGDISWLKLILTYIETRAGVRDLFYKIVPGYKPNMKGPCARSSFEKTYPEIIRCANIPNDAKVIFFDDLWHAKMSHKNLTYVRVKGFYHPLRTSFIIKKLQNSFFSFLDYSTHSYLYKCIRNFHNQYISYSHHNKSSRVKDNDIIIPLYDFLGIKKKTVRHRKKKRNKTKKSNQ